MHRKLHRGRVARALVALAGCAALCAVPAASASAAPLSHGQKLHVVKPRLHVNTNQSSNWFGYNQGTLEQGGKMFNSISGDWTVPTATQHASGDEFSSDWIGIGGGCVDAGCTVGDNTLIQTGTEQDVSGGTASYGAWWEIIPGPSISITNMTVAAGDHMHADITEPVAGSNVWTITLRNVTRNQTFTQTVPYTSTHATAEWIEETPLILGTGAGFAALPNLTTVPFTNAKTNGAPANLAASEEIQLIDSAGKVIGSPSAPNASRDGFSACAWATSC
jgi:peptidase A4-like protein